MTVKRVVGAFFWLKMVLKDFGYCLITASRDGDESKKILPLM